MRRRSDHKGYLFLLVALLLIVSTPVPRARQLRGVVVASMAPTWRGLAHAKAMITTPIAALSGLFRRGKQSHDSERTRHTLELENQQLKTQLRAASDLLTQERLTHTLREEAESSDGYHLPESISLIRQALPAAVVYRSPDAWNHSLWIDAGWRNNADPEHPIIAKDSPVVVGCGVVGVIDHVGARQSRVRLITDPGLTPSVRSARGIPQHLATAAAIDQVIATLEPTGAESSAVDPLRESLVAYKEQLLNNGGYHYLAKGELTGSSDTLWRRRVPLLRGTGFNYDFDDEAGPARDLFTGAVKNSPTSEPIPLIAKGDLLVTTGMDGVYPAGLHVATVTKVAPLREGGYYYDLEARPVVGTLSVLETVFILPPQSDHIRDPL